MFLYSTVSTLNPAGNNNSRGKQVRGEDREGMARMGKATKYLWASLHCHYDTFRILTDGRDGGHDLSKLELVQNGCLETCNKGWKEGRAGKKR